MNVERKSKSIYKCYSDKYMNHGGTKQVDLNKAEEILLQRGWKEDSSAFEGSITIINQISTATRYI